MALAVQLLQTLLQIENAQMVYQMSVYKKLNQLRIKFHAGQIKKSGSNDFAKFKYLQLDDFIVRALTICDEIGLCGVVSYTADYASLRIVDVDDGTEVEITSPMGSASLKGVHEVQNIGAVETYQRRYLWVTALEIVEHDALDASVGPTKGEAEAETAEAYLNAINGAETSADLHSAFGAAWKSTSNKDRQSEYKTAYETRKSELTEHKEAA